MPRDVYGTYTLPTPQNPVVSGQTISAADFNDTMDDIATALTESLNVDGTKPYDAPIQMVNGSPSAPGYTFQSNLGDGIFRNSSTGIGVSWVGVERFRVNATYSGFNGIDVHFVPGATWPLPASQLGPTVSPSISSTGSPAYLLIRRIVVTQAMSPYTLTTTTGARRIVFTCIGAGGGGGSPPATTTSNFVVAGGGGGGGYAKKTLTGTQIETTYTVAIGAGGAVGVTAAGGNNGSAGGNTTVTGGTSSTLWCRADGGAGGNKGTVKTNTAASDPPAINAAAAAGGAGNTGDELYAGSPGEATWHFVPNSGYGTWSPAPGGCSVLFPIPCPLDTAVWLPGQGACGKVVYETTAAGGTAGSGNGADGLCIIEEFF